MAILDTGDATVSNQNLGAICVVLVKYRCDKTYLTIRENIFCVCYIQKAAKKE
jgi:hypothetical protein